MTPLDSFLFLGATVGLLWGLWLLLQFVFDSIEDYHAAWREERHRASQPPAEDGGQLTRERESSEVW